MMIAKIQQTYPSLETITNQARFHFGQPIQKLDTNAKLTHFADKSRAIIQSLPLDTEDFDTANQRIKNAKRYLASHEVGAARYELTLLSRRLRMRLR